MRIVFLGAAHEVTGSCTLVYACGRKILIDCGMEQGADIYENCDLPIKPNEIDCILLTHAHIDHSGKLPAMTANGYEGPIYATRATAKLCNIMLLDSAHIQEQEAIWRNRKAKRAGEKAYVPLYTTMDAWKTLPLFVPCDYEKEYDIFDGVKVRFFDSGHLLGSSSIEVTVTENNVTKTIVFSGDVGNIDRPLIRDPKKPEKADYVIVESTYGVRLHGERKDYVSQMTAIIQDTLDRGGNLVIPAFAIGRTQELLYLIQQIKSQDLVKNHPDFPVWIDSPLAIEATQIYSGDMMEYYDERTLQQIREGINVLSFNGLNVAVTSEESIQMNKDRTPKVIISASGMCEAGRIRHHLKHNLWRSDSTILFVGYQAVGTLGRSIIEGARTVKLFGEKVQVSAQIEIMDGISGHADKQMLLDWLGNIKKAPELVFVNHGDDIVCDQFAAEISAKLNFEAVAPYNGAEYDLLTKQCLAEGNKEYIERKVPKIHITTSIFDRLLMAGRRLLDVIERNKNASDKEMTKFARQINDLCDKWDK